MARILLVEDDLRTVALVSELLEASGHDPASVTLGGAAIARLRAEPFDLVVLDINLPDRDGFSVCAEIRTFSAVPVLILSARGGADDRVDGLRLGADDYLPKPYDPRELLARIEAIGRRTGQGAAVRGAGVMAAGPLRLALAARTVTLHGAPVELTAAEFDILRVLVARAGRVVSRERLSRLSRGVEIGVFDRVLDVHISRIRKKLGDDPRAPALLKTVRGVGYTVAAAPC